MSRAVKPGSLHTKGTVLSVWDATQIEPSLLCALSLQSVVIFFFSFGNIDFVFTEQPS